MSASEMRTFIAYFGLMIGDKVDPFDSDFDGIAPEKPLCVQQASKKPMVDDFPRFFHLYALLSEIITIISSAGVSEGEVT